MTWFKMCGFTRIDDIEYAIELGASAIGIVGEPSSPRYVSADNELIQRASGLPARLVRVYGPWRNEPSHGFDVYQAHSLPTKSGKEQWLTLAIGTSFAWPALIPHCDAVLLDAASPTEYGGTGHRIEVSLLEDLMATAPMPVIIAGGLNPDNVGEVIRRCQPMGVDVASGIESRPGIKDLGRMQAFAQAVLSAQFPL